MYTSPAMLGKTYADDLRAMDDELFAVATMLFQIVMTGQFPYMRTGTDGDMVQLIREGNFAFQISIRGKEYNARDQPDGDWKYLWSHIHKPVKDLFWDTFHKEGKRYDKRPSATEWLEAFKTYKAYLRNEKLSFDAMSNDVRPIRHKAFKPNTPIVDCPTCGRKHAIAGFMPEGETEYIVPRRCNKCRDSQPSRPAASRPIAPAHFACKDCGNSFLRQQLTYGRCPACTTQANSLDSSRLCADCQQPFITYDHIGWFQSRLLDVPKSHSAIKQTCPRSMAPIRSVTTIVPPPQGGAWARFKKWLQNS